jgi:hypothetical protein
VTQLVDGMTFPCGPFDCECEASVKCPAGKKVSACYCYNSNPRTKTDDKREYADAQKYPNRGHPAHKGSFPWMLASVAGFDGIPGEVSDDGTCSCSWINTILLVSGVEHGLDFKSNMLLLQLTVSNSLSVTSTSHDLQLQQICVHACGA